MDDTPVALVLAFLGAVAEAGGAAVAIIELAATWRRRWPRPKTHAIDGSQAVGVKSATHGDVEAMTDGVVVELNGNPIDGVNKRISDIESAVYAQLGRVRTDSERSLAAVAQEVEAERARTDAEERASTRHALIIAGPLLAAGVLLQLAAAICAVADV